MTRNLVRWAPLAVAAWVLALAPLSAPAATMKIRVISLGGQTIAEEDPKLTVRVTVKDAAVRGNERFLFSKDLNTGGDTIDVPPDVKAVRLEFDDKGANVLENALLTPLANVAVSLTVVMPEKPKADTPPAYDCPCDCPPPPCCEAPPAQGGHRRFSLRHR